jgi:ABC transporter substrate binding protein
MNRRVFITLLGGAAVAWPLAARAQQSAKMLRVGTVAGTPRSSPHWVAFERRMAELSYDTGKNFAFEFMQAASIEEYVLAYRELAARKVDVFLASGPEITLKSALAAAERGATVLWDRISADQWNAAQSAAPALGLRLVGIELREQPYDYEQALAQGQSDQRRNLFVMSSPFFFRDRTQLADLALRHRMTSMFAFREWVDAGGLLSYGPSITGMFRSAADYVDRIARGAKPADLPIEQPTKFELVLNLKTARAIGIELPTPILLRADEVIE